MYGNSIQWDSTFSKELVDFPSSGNRVYYRSPLAHVLPRKQLHSFEYYLNRICTGQGNFVNHFRHQQQERCSQLGMVRCRRNHRPYSRHLPDRLPDGQHGSHSVYHSLLAHVPRFLFYRLFHRPETLRNPRLGMVYGIRHSGYPLLIADIVATSHRSPLCSLHDLFHIPHHRTFPCHAFIWTKEFT